jgi:predicted phosphodiesterase
MRYGILSDIHSNLEALNAVLSFLKTQNVDGYISSGDIVGYGPNPNECVELFRELSPLWISVGNHDLAACMMKDLSWFNDYAQKSLLWTRQRLSVDNQIFLSELPRIVRHSDFTIVHGSLRDNLTEYLITREDYKNNEPFLKTRLTFVGHTHVPFVLSSHTAYVFRGQESIKLNTSDKFIINPGSTGQPRDNNIKASCAIFDSNSDEVSLYRIEYDIMSTQEKMHKERLPAFLIERLSWGK